jgi:class 3 adenylate cyclase
VRPTIQRADRANGIPSRAGVHCGEVERSGAAIRGISVHIASRLSALAAPSEILASTTVRDLAAGSGIQFEDRGMHNLKGVPDLRQVLAVAA